MIRLTETEAARATGFMKAFKEDLMSMIYESWKKTDYPIGGLYARSAKTEDIPDYGILLPEVVEGSSPVLRIVHKKKDESKTVAVAVVQAVRGNDYSVITTGPLSDCVLLSDVVAKAKTILLNID
jgi:hypothetical protein